MKILKKHKHLNTESYLASALSQKTNATEVSFISLSENEDGDEKEKT